MKKLSEKELQSIVGGKKKKKWSALQCAMASKGCQEGYKSECRDLKAHCY